MKDAPASAADASAGAQTPTSGAESIFDDVAEEVGLDFVHWNGRSGELYFAEVMGSGAALFDADGDGDLDAYLAQGNRLDERDSIDPPPYPPPLSGRLYRNQLRPEGVLRFVDVTEDAGLADAAGHPP